MLNQPYQVDSEDNHITVEQKLDEPMIKAVEKTVDMLKNGKELSSVETRLRQGDELSPQYLI